VPVTRRHDVLDRAHPAATARRAPPGLATRAKNSTPASPDTYPATSSASAMLGIAFGDTNAVASIRWTPVATDAASSRTLASVLIGASICRPSRGPTSRRSTRCGRASVLIRFPSPTRPRHR
jgi:hypothetical protein